jgi:HSP20 family protein
MLGRRDYSLKRFLNELAGFNGEFGNALQKPQDYQQSVYPAVNAWVGPAEAVVISELPGFSADEVDISVVGLSLTFRGKRKEQDVEKTYLRKERNKSDFSRTLELPFEIDIDQIEATFDKGILTVKLPRAEADQPKQIKIKCA